MQARLITAGLLALLLLFQAQLWIGRGSIPEVMRMQRALQAQTVANEQLRQSNTQLANQVRDLREGLDLVEEMARMQLGMVKPNEIFVQFSK